ncbi:MAG TPA: hypothetical protein VHA75_15830 [Rugosimonospora sp.]|nr:hypothetical protein [Rugosimonospora sp.]
MFVYAASDGLAQWEMGAMVTLHKGETWFADDPFVKARPDLFSSTPTYVRNTMGAEQPTPTPLSAPARKRTGKASG